ncbi:MAG: hypothetical protein ACI81L_000659 [Verrucomicrobiales bacterium]
MHIDKVGKAVGDSSPGDAPNENLSREFLELFMLGRNAGYTEDDVRAGARILSGWWVDWENGEVGFDYWQLQQTGQVPFEPPNVAGWPDDDRWSSASRRRFLGMAAAGVAAVGGGALALNRNGTPIPGLAAVNESISVSPTPTTRPLVASKDVAGRTLVVIELAGGNDGLGTRVCCTTAEKPCISPMRSSSISPMTSAGTPDWRA